MKEILEHWETEACPGPTSWDLNTRNGLLRRIKEYEEKLAVLKQALLQFPGER